MKITLKKGIIEQVPIEKLREFKINESQLDWEGSITIDITEFDIETLKNLQNILLDCKESPKTQDNLKELENWIDICESGHPVIKEIKLLAPALVQYIDQSPGHRIHIKHEFHEKYLCCLVSKIEFTPSNEMEPDKVKLEYIYDMFGNRKSDDISFTQSQIKNKTIPQILANHDIYIETDQLRQNYQESIEKFRPIIKQIGVQYLLDGYATGNTPDGYDYRYSRPDQFISENHKVVIDKLYEKKEREHEYEKVRSTGITFWKQQHKIFENMHRPLKSDIVHITKNLEIPIHPILVIFDFKLHRRLTAHVDYLKKYTYDKDLAKKLVLSENPKTLVDTLIEYKEGGFEDIIHGKSGGVIVLLAGPAGVGKTLTAEVFAESKEKPLYTIQAAQLGTSPNDLEQELQICLDRAKRWDAVLLIDEADVYIHRRENNIDQNAIVGAFLRVLEYHSSFLFMTTNRSDVVDDAIASRCIAKIDYQYPTKEEQKKIWEILAKTSKISIEEGVIDKFISTYGNTISGRDVKNILKLANLVSKSKNSPITIDTLKHVIQFNPTRQENRKWLFRNHQNYQEYHIR